MMEIVSFKLQGEILKEVDALLQPLHFNNRTEFIREAVREKLHRIETTLFMETLAKHKGAAKVCVNDRKLKEIREDVTKKYAEKFGIRLD
ncbi:hypothetical protein CMO92_03510 [Candidatus Woesearchaeota archaeon]|nr:hypothetical protein [Candidatus Woesearchaeota archaeon]